MKIIQILVLILSFFHVAKKILSHARCRGWCNRLSLTGDIPRFVNNNHDVCIDNATAIGYSGIPAVDGLPQLLESVKLPLAKPEVYCWHPSKWLFASR